jgi:nicotinamide-nucleotide amidase
MTAGIGESAIAEKIKDIENELPNHISLAYLPSLKRVKLRLTASHSSEEIEKAMEVFQNQIAERLKKYVFSFNENDSLEKVLGAILKTRNETLATAESCTGGLIAHKITSVAGSSAYYVGSAITYSNEMKMQELGVQQSTLDKYGAVSEATVIEMTKGLLKKTKTTYGIAVSGVAGPGGGTADKPVGTVWIAVNDKDSFVTRKYHLTPYREINIQLTAVLALNLLRRFINNDLEKRGSSNDVLN